VLLAYVDESGDPFGDPAQRGSAAYALGVVVVRDLEWADAFDALINMRRNLKATFGIPARAEVKAAYLVRNEGAMKGLGLSGSQRRYIYRRHFQVMERSSVRAFAIVVDKQRLTQAHDLHRTRELVWNTLFQRLSLMHDRDDGSRLSPVLLVHDEGEELTIRKYARRARRYLTAGSAFGTGSIRLSERWLIDDPVSRQSDHSLFVQCADLVAYAATKRLFPGGARATRVCPPSTWDALGSAIHRPVNALAISRGAAQTPGIVPRP
jgi:hypothetical protein